MMIVWPKTRLKDELLINQGNVLNPNIGYFLCDGECKRIFRTHLLRGNESPFIATDRGENYIIRYSGESLHNKRLMMWCEGGIGDIMFMTPIIDFMKDRYPTSSVTVGTSLMPSDILTGYPNIENRKTFLTPPTITSLLKYDYHIFFEGLWESGDAWRMHIVDLYAQYCCVGPIPNDEKLLSFHLSDEEKESGKRFIEHNKLDADKLIVMQVASTTMMRNYPPEYCAKVANTLAERGYQVLLVGVERDNTIVSTQSYSKGVYNACGATKSIRQVASILWHARLFIGPDSSMVHIANSKQFHHMKSVAIYGPFPSKLRTRYYKNCISLETDGAPCAPCLIHGIHNCERAKVGEPSPCFVKYLPPERVIDAALKTLEE